MAIEGDVVTAANLQSIAGINHGFFTRQGGLSSGVYSSLNCGLGSADDRSTVSANRNLVARHLGAAAGQLVTVHQCHSALALTVDRPFAEDAVPKADAVVTNTPGLAVAALAADCAPILFADPIAKVVAAAHAGWRGALGGILEATLVAMERLGARRGRIVAAIGPCIHQPNYEVGTEFEAQFVSMDADYRRFFRVPPPSSKSHFDLPGFVAHRLLGAGVTNVATSEHCTYGDPQRFFSFRRTTHCREPDYGRQISAIVVT